MSPNDPRSKLVFSFVEVVEILNPKAFVMENVKALGSLAKFGEVREKLIRRFQTLGFSLTIAILNAKDFGIPQSRERVFFVGVKQPYKKLSVSDFNKFKRQPKTLREAISHLGPAGSKTNPRICKAKVTIAAKPVLRKSPYAGMLFNGQGRPLNPDGWSSTLPASMGGNRTPIIDEDHLYKHKDSWVEKYHAHLISGGNPYSINDVPPQLRRLTVDEAAILQTFPTSYNFEGPQSSVFSQIGNAVPCRLADAVASTLKLSLQKKKSITNLINKGETIELEFDS